LFGISSRPPRKRFSLTSAGTKIPGQVITAFHVTSGFIHVLLILALISLVMHLVRGKSSVA
jgi:hypothetical protein